MRRLSPAGLRGLVALADYVRRDHRLSAGAERRAGVTWGWAAVRRPRGILLPQGALPRGMRPPLSSSQSPLSSVSACGENCARSLAPPLPHRAGRGGGPLSVLPKEKWAVHGLKEKKCVARCGAVALRADGGRRIGASADFGPPSGTLGPSARSILRPVADGAEVVGVQGRI